jgi:cysteinyl-tRNA synthetase
MALQLHDTMTGKLQTVVPLEAGHVRIYTCGPTVWNRAHIGNFRTFIFEDVLRRVLEQRFARVTHVMNLTDVDDRIINNTMAHGHTLDEETAPWIAAFFADVDALGIRRAHHYPRATEYIEQMVSLIERLERNQVTYRSDGSVYFHIAAFPSYGRLSGVQASGLIAGASGRIDADDYAKEDARDFALWKAASADQPAWDTRLGRGHPGWHIECSAMSMALLGESFDIHCGGVDNIFPHHENEIAQSEAATHKRFVSLWCHSAHLYIDEEKMSKRKGNFFSLQDIIEDEGQRPSTIRYLLAATVHYRKVLNYSPESLEASAAAVDRLSTFRDRLTRLEPAPAGERRAVELAAQARQRFDVELDDDLNFPAGMGHVFTAIRDANRMLDGNTVDAAGREAMLDLLAHVDDVLGVLPLVDRERKGDLTDEQRALLDKRAGARADRDWAASDALRNQLIAAGIHVEDTPGGQRWRRIV